MEAPAIGIDLGTTYSCVGVYERGHVKIIPNEYGHRITPSCVSFTENGHIIGHDAKIRVTMKPTNTVCEIKRLMGRSFHDAAVQNQIPYWPFKVENIGSKPNIVVMVDGKRQTYTPEEISAMILGKMKKIAEDYLQKTVKNAVITVPAYFNDNQRQATKNAATIAGLNVLRIINEPEAAALAYNLTNGSSDAEKNVVIFDLGGGTFDISILTIDDGIIEVQAKKGDTNLGGSDFDNRILDHILDLFNKTHSNLPAVKKDDKSREIHRLRRACEFAKCRLTDDDSAEVRIEAFHEQNDLLCGISRAEFVTLNNDLFIQTINMLEDALSDAKIRVPDVTDVVLVGGSTRIPEIQKIVQRFFKGKKLDKSINPDEAVAYGAAIQASLLDRNSSGAPRDVLLLDVTPLSLGIMIKGDLMSTIVKRNTLIPIQGVGNYTTCNDNQHTIGIAVYQGERAMVTDNHKLGAFSLTDIPPAPAGVPQIKVTFDIDANGMLDVIAENEETGTEEFITIENSSGRMSKAEIDRIVKESQRKQGEDLREKDRILARNSLESYARWLKYLLTSNTVPQRMSAASRKTIISHCDATIRWLIQNTNETREQYVFKKTLLERACNEIPGRFKIPGSFPSDVDFSRPETPRTARNNNHGTYNAMGGILDVD